jgi:hypothetical protein
MNAWSAPARIGYTHLSYQILNLARRFGPALCRAALPSPIEPEPFAVPGGDGGGLYNAQCGTPVVPEMRQLNPEDAIHCFQTKPFPALRTLQNKKLMA